MKNAFAKAHLEAESALENIKTSGNILKACHLGLRDAGFYLHKGCELAIILLSPLSLLEEALIRASAKVHSPFLNQP